MSYIMAERVKYPGKPQTERLWQDLGTVFSRSVLIGGLLTAAIGCSAKVDSWDSSPARDGRTMVELNLLQDRPPECIASPEVSKPASKSVVPAEKPVVHSGSTMILDFRTGDVTYHSEVHVHVHANPTVTVENYAARPENEEQIGIRRRVEAEPRRAVDPRCERLAREHEERVRRWRDFVGNN